jgi:two-component system OmpR family sensor kinase
MPSLRRRILTGYVVQVALILIVFSAALYLVLWWRLGAEIDAHLADRLHYIESKVDLDGKEIEFEFHAGEFAPDLFWRVSLPDGTVLGRSNGFEDFEPAPPFAVDPHSTTIWDTNSNGEPLRAARKRIVLGGRPHRFTAEWSTVDGEATLEEKPPKPARRTAEVDIDVARSLRPRNESLIALLGILGVAVPLTIAVAVLGGSRLVRRALEPVAAFARSAEHIGPESLAARVPQPATRDEIGRLAIMINGMLERIENGFQRERRFTSDASHELRSPLTALRGEIEVALRRPRTTDEYASVLREALEDVERLERLVAGLLLLARVDAGQIASEPSIVDLWNVVDGAVEIAMRDAAADAIECCGVRGVVPVQGVAELLAVLVRNLIENALRHGAAPIRVELDASTDRATLTVSDHGPGIPAEALPRIFDRFYRADAARSRSSGGTGLGLAIARAIAIAHGGRIRAESPAAGGARVIVELPLAGTRSEAAVESSHA